MMMMMMKVLLVAVRAVSLLVHVSSPQYVARPTKIYKNSWKIPTPNSRLHSTDIVQQFLRFSKIQRLSTSSTYGNNLGLHRNIEILPPTFRSFAGSSLRASTPPCLPPQKPKLRESSMKMLLVCLYAPRTGDLY